MTISLFFTIENLGEKMVEKRFGFQMGERMSVRANQLFTNLKQFKQGFTQAVVALGGFHFLPRTDFGKLTMAVIIAGDNWSNIGVAAKWTLVGLQNSRHSNIKSVWPLALGYFLIENIGENIVEKAFWISDG